MIKQFKYKEIIWLDVESPTSGDIAALGKQFSLHPLVLDELTRPSLHPKVDVYSDYVYLVLHFPLCQICYGGKPPPSDSQEIDFIIGKNFLITTHYEMINALNDFGKIFESDLALHRQETQVHAGFIFYYILRELYAALAQDLNYVNDRLKMVEKKVFNGQEKEMVKTLTEINRDLLDFQWALKTHREVLANLELAGSEMFGVQFRYYLRAITNEYSKIWQMIKSNRATFADLRETNESLLSIKTNETMRMLTVLAFVFLPITILAQIFSMQTPLPLAGGPLGFYKITALMLSTVAIVYAIARRRRWI